MGGVAAFGFRSAGPGPTRVVCCAQDFSFYGNKVFQSSFIQILSPGASLLTTLLWTLLNSGCALIG